MTHDRRQRLNNTTTVVFADLVGSTALFERLGDHAAGRFVTQFLAVLARAFEQHRGRVVKLLGDGVLVLFPSEADALAGCVAVQSRLREQPMHADGGPAMQVQMGIDAGEVVAIEGDCYGDSINSAARLADLAGADQILASRRVHDALPPSQQRRLRALGAMYLRGKTDAVDVYRVEWQDDAGEPTVMGASVFVEHGPRWLELTAPGQSLRLQQGGEPVTLGRASSAALVIHDARVSRVHATVHWRGGHFVLADVSSSGTWVYFGGQPQPLVLRRAECLLVGEGEIAVGGELGPGSPASVHFAVRG